MQADVIVIGGGHNALTAAAYLGKSGLRVLVLEARDQIGGGTITEELTLPGLLHDTFSSGHPWLLSHPMIAHDELGLISNHGLRYVGHDPLVTLPFADGEQITVWRDAERTAREVERFSHKDAKAWLNMLALWKRLAPTHLARVKRSPSEFQAETSTEEAEYRHLLNRSALDVTCEMFESEHVRSLALWFAAVTVQPIDRVGTGLLPISVPAGWAAYGWMNAIGGASALVNALARVVREQGGEVRTGVRVKRIVTHEGSASGVETEKGEILRASRGVMSAAHVADLPSLLTKSNGEKEVLPIGFTDGVRGFRAGPSLFVVHLVLKSNPVLPMANRPALSAVLTGRATVEGMKAHIANVRNGALTWTDPYFLAGCSTIIDPSRAPQGQGIVKLVTLAPYALNGDAKNWLTAKDEYANWLVDQYRQLIGPNQLNGELARFVQTPLEIATRNTGFYCGSPQGGEMLPDQMGMNRPFEGWADYRMPIAKLYQTGFSTHPGGPVSGWPGLHAAAAVLQDLNLPVHSYAFAGQTPAPTFTCPVINTAE